ncbi:30-kDa cleavage and polyadenylation specificity factor 30 isoform X2 [Morus notabilis]|uniref:30-kDa cleavage and polyadenylation specificity factor 30 isoform X2 n=1 Tax=Morus notabilis TaxID=981085 RepID=UPI000CECF462|nr:30-kDa cleavage and polyadenylation specificity factor 30 isoform X2 [Morus notabilis]
MEDSEGVLSFDFEGGLDTTAGGCPPNAAAASAALIHPDSSAAAASNNLAASNSAVSADPTSGGGGGASNPGRGRSFRQTVCRHWLRSLCMKGEACGFLHQYDKSRMPVCRFFRLYGECREQDCVYKHTNEDIKECNMYKLGFCPNGPDCRYRHAKLPGPPPSVEEVLQKIQHLSSYNYHSNKFFQQRNAGGFAQLGEKPLLPLGPNAVSQGVVGKPSILESANVQQPQQQVQPSQQPVGQNQIQNVFTGLPNQANRTVAPLPPGISRYFIVKSCNRENLELSVQQGVWATQRSNEAKLNEAFDCAENVILIFSVNRTRHFQGCAKMISRIGGSISGGNWKYAHGTAHYGRNFSVKWLKLCELSFHKTRHLRNPYNENLPVKAISLAAESKREEEKAKGVDPDNGGENPDIVPFEDNEEDEEEESEDEEESFSQVLGANQGRGRGRGVMWPPHMPLSRGARPMPSMQGFPPVMIGADGSPYGPVTPDGFPMPDLFNVGPRAFNPYGPRFPGDFMGPTSGMMFRGRPTQPGAVFPGGGFGMMMGPGRAPCMGGMGVQGTSPARPMRPGAMPPMFQQPPPPSQNMNRPPRRDQRGLANDRNERYGAGSDQVRGQEMSGPAGGPEDDAHYQLGAKARQEDQYGAGNSFRNDESESEDEAPRRSRHGDGKKKRRSSEEDAATGSDH